ncbi:hypothetical protein QR680_002386 [Steinernema hermaphroditum]|uniref:glucuronosyltransferase n=1 Tax=Steinernema hermaphroditum TaxID=289476 RepID=A0AA39LI61_9BILA|nr:hypothetical protein QR680_002386 [Steinernema hermaphroditum]
MLRRALGTLLLMLAVGHAYKILVYSPKIGHSHVNFLGKIADILVEAGNDVTVLAPETQPAVRTNGTKLAKVVIVDIDEKIKKIIDLQEIVKIFWSTDAQNPLLQLKAFKDQEVYGKMLCEEMLSKTELLRWIESEKFDVVISEAFDPCFIGTYKALRIKAHVIASATFLLETVSYSVGVPVPPSTIPSSFSGLTDRMTFFERIKNVLGFGVVHWWLGGMVNVHQSVVDSKYGEGYTNIMEEMGDCSLIITNSDPLLDFPRPTLDKVINIGGVSVPKPKPLTEEWEEILSRREKTVLVSFGSITQSQWMPEKMKKTLIECFKRFPEVTFIWKYERPEDNLAEDAPNVVIIKWVPQNDLLNHKNLTMFVTHAGMNSILEAANRGIPLLSIPLFGDQMRNAKMIVRAEIGEEADKSLLYDADGFSRKLRNVLENEEYAKKAKRLAEMMSNRPISHRENLVKHIEFVARFGRLPNMKPASVELSFIQYFLLDIIAVAAVVTLLTLIVCFIVIRKVIRLCLSKLPSKAKSD